MAVGTSSTNEAAPREEAVDEGGPGFCGSPGSPALTISPSQQLWRLWMLRRAFQTAEPHLKPEPAGRCQLLHFFLMARAPVQICSYSGTSLVLQGKDLCCNATSCRSAAAVTTYCLHPQCKECDCQRGAHRSEGAPKPICHTVSPLADAA